MGFDVGAPIAVAEVSAEYQIVSPANLGEIRQVVVDRTSHEQPLFGQDVGANIRLAAGTTQTGTPGLLQCEGKPGRGRFQPTKPQGREAVWNITHENVVKGSDIGDCIPNH